MEKGYNCGIFTKQCLDKALSFANELFLSLESRGHHVVIAPKSEKFYRESFEKHEVPKNYSYQSLWSPWRCAVVYIGTVAIGLTMVEMSKEVEVRYVNGKYIPEKEYAKSKRRRYSSSYITTKALLAAGLLRLDPIVSRPQGQCFAVPERRMVSRMIVGVAA